MIPSGLWGASAECILWDDCYLLNSTVTTVAWQAHKQHSLILCSEGEPYRRTPHPCHAQRRVN